MTESTTVDTGTGYGRKRPSHDARLTEVGPGTPMGEAMRRYWHPVATSETLTNDQPHRIRVLGEDLIVFRDGQGRAGVVYERCAHRGSSLFYGRIEDDGIRCCYHGWKFDVQGHCLEQACEPGGGRRREVARQPWYPVEERYGLVFVYMGPPDRKPASPTTATTSSARTNSPMASSRPARPGRCRGSWSWTCERPDGRPVMVGRHHNGGLNSLTTRSITWITPEDRAGTGSPA